MTFPAALLFIGLRATPAPAERPPSVLLLTTVSDEGPAGFCKTGSVDAGGQYEGATSVEHDLIAALSPAGWTFPDPCALGVEPPNRDHMDRVAMFEGAAKAQVTLVVTGSILVNPPLRSQESPVVGVSVIVNLKVVDLRTASVAGAISATVAAADTTDANERIARKKALAVAVSRITAWLRNSARPH